MSAPALDHLVVAARSLAEGVDWCEAILGVTPLAGGHHALMGTHNRVLSVASPEFPRAYLEIIAIDHDAPAPARARWFDLDDAALQAACATAPQLIHWVLRCDDIEARCKRLRALGIERGEIIEAERSSPKGLLRWRISVRADGQRLFQGALPTLIQWGERHPCDAMAASGVTLTGLALAGLAPAVGAELTVGGVTHVASGAPLRARLSTPRGSIELHAPRLGNPPRSA